MPHLSFGTYVEMLHCIDNLSVYWKLNKNNKDNIIMEQVIN